MKKVKLISKTDQGIYKQGQVIRTIEVEPFFDLNKITVYYDFEVIPVLTNN
jgi:hypothetical protein